MSTSKVKFIGVHIENFRKLKAVYMQVKASGLTIIRGDNEQGKTTVLDAIQYLLKGKKAIKSSPVRQGEKKATVKGDFELENGELVSFERISTEKSDRIEVYSADGEKKAFASPTTFLENLINALTFNPFAFLNEKPKDKVKFLLNLCSLDFTSINNDIELKSAERTIIGRTIKQMGEILFDPTIQTKDITELIARKNKCNEENKKTRSEFEQLKELNIKEAESHNALREEIIGKHGQANAMMNELVSEKTQINIKISETESQISELEEKIVALKQKRVKQNEELSTIKTRIVKGETFIKRLDPIPEIRMVETTIKAPEYIDTGEIEKEIEEAQIHNADCLENEKKKDKMQEKKDLQSEYNKLTNEIEALRKSKTDQLKEQNFGVNGLEITEDDVLINGIPSDSWSDSQGIDLACRLCMAQNPKLRALFVDRGEIFGKKKLDILEKWCEENEIGVIMTKVDDCVVKQEEKDGVYTIEDGMFV